MDGTLRAPETKVSLRRRQDEASAEAEGGKGYKRSQELRPNLGGFSTSSVVGPFSACDPPRMGESSDNITLTRYRSPVTRIARTFLKTSRFR